MIKKLKQIVNRFEELEKLLTDPEILSDNAKVIEISKERSSLEDVVNQSKEYIALKYCVAFILFPKLLWYS